jgi:hypothetical protein
VFFSSLSAQGRVDPSVGKHVVGVGDPLLLKLITLAVSPKALGLAVIVFPGLIQESQSLKSPQRAKVVPFAGHVNQNPKKNHLRPVRILC